MNAALVVKMIAVGVLFFLAVKAFGIPLGIAWGIALAVIALV